MEAAKVKGRPAKQLPITFEWQTGPWLAIFDKHVDLVQQDVLRSLAADRMVTYLSCPISSRGGSFSTTNVEIAETTARRLVDAWGTRFWFLNPGQYQLESKHGTGLIRRHARLLELEKELEPGFDVDALIARNPPAGGDYMRMWTRVLAEDGEGDLGERFSAYYFIGPADYWHFFTQGGRLSVSAGVEEYFARKFALDADFNAFFAGPFLDAAGAPLPDQRREWDRRRKEFLRYYTVRASAGFSRGSHDEWNIWLELNRLRVKRLGVGAHIPGYFGGQQIDMGSGEVPAAPGYADPAPPSVPVRLPSLAPPSVATSYQTAVEALVDGAPTASGDGSRGAGEAP